LGEFAKIKRGLQALFPSSGTVVHDVSELRSDIQLVHPFPSQAADLETSSRQSFTSAAALSPVIASIPAQPQETYDDLIIGHVGHSFAGMSRVRVNLVDPAGGAIVMGIVAFDSTVEGFVPLFATTQPGNPAAMSPVRPILVPPGWSIQAFGQTQAVAYTITLAFMAIRRPLADVPLFR